LIRELPLGVRLTMTITMRSVSVLSEQIQHHVREEEKQGEGFLQRPSRA